MRHIFSICMLILLVGISVGCRKELHLPESTEPVFWVEADLDGESIHLQAGIDDYYLDADYRIDSFGVKEFLGTFRPTSCESCRESMRIVIRDKVVSTVINSPTEVPSTFVAETLPYRGQVFQTDSLTFSFKAHSSGTPPFTYSWNFGEELNSSFSSNETEPAYSYSGSGLYEVSVEIKDANGCLDVSRHQVRAGKFFHHCQIGFAHEWQGNNSVAFKATPEPFTAEFQEVYWNFGDGHSNSQEFAPSHTYDHPGIYEVKMVLIKADGTVCCDIKNVFSEEGASCASFIEYEPVLTDPYTGSVYIEWTNEEGEVYTTDGPAGQGLEHSFRILSVGPEWTDIDQQKAIQLSAEFSCRLYKRSNPEEFLEIRNGKTEFAVAYP
ncbi:MAG: PKD domain-containing protein [Bacteroidota bacterium]